MHTIEQALPHIMVAGDLDVTVAPDVAPDSLFDLTVKFQPTEPNGAKAFLSLDRQTAEQLWRRLAVALADTRQQDVA